MQKFTSLRSFVIVLFSSLLSLQANAQCAANFTTSSSLPPGCTISFVDASIGTNPNTQYSWNFGDNQTSSAQNPTNTYTATGTYTVCLTISVPSSFGNICIDTFCNTVNVQCGTTNGVSNILNEKTISIYPNPSNGKFQLANKQTTLDNLKMTIYNAVGEKIYSTKTGNSQLLTVDISSQPNGVYFLKISSKNNESFTQKLIIQK